MIDSGQVVNGLWMGMLLILLGLAPELLQKCGDLLVRFPSIFQTGFPLPVRVCVPFRRMPWLAHAGILLILLTMLAGLSR